MANDIKISANMDSSSFRQFNSTLVTLTSSIKVLNGELEKMARTVKTINTGGISQGAANLNVAPGKDKGGITSTLIGEGAGRVASEAKQAMNSVANDAKRMADSVLGDIKRLRGSDAGWSNRANFAIQTGIGTGVPMSPDAGWSNRAYEALGHPFTPNPSAGSIAPSGAPTNPSAGSIAPSGAPTNPIVPSTNRGGSGSMGFGGILGGAGSAGSAAEAVVGGNMSALIGSTIGRMGAVGAAAYAGYRIGSAWTETGQDLYSSNLNFKINNPLEQMQIKSQMASPFRSMFGTGISRNYAQMLGWDRTFQNKDLMSTLRNVQLNRETANAIQGELGAMGMGKDALAVVGAWSGKKWERVFASPDLRSLTQDEQRDIRTVALQKLQQQVPADMANRISQAQQAEMGVMNPLTELMVNEIGQNALGRVKSLGAAGLRAGIIKGRNGRPDMTSDEYYAAQDVAGGWDRGDRIAQYQGVLGFGRGYAGISRKNYLVSSSLAGLTNSGQLIRAAGTIGGGVNDAGYFYNEMVQATIGSKTGLDVAAARDLYGGVAQSALATGMYGSSNLNWVSQSLGTMVFGGGQDVAGQQRSLESFTRGNVLESAFTSGTRSPFDRVVANEASIAAAGGFSAKSMALMRMSKDPRLLGSIANGAAVPEWAEGLVTKETAGSFLDRTRRARFAGVTDTLFSSDPLRRGLLSDLRSMDNDSNAVMRQRLATTGLKEGSRAWWKAERKLANQLGSILSGDPLANAGMMDEAFARNLGLLGPKGSGAWRPRPTGAEAVALAHEKGIKRLEGEAGATEEVQGGVTSAKPVTTARAAVSGVGSVKGAINDFGQAAQTLVNALNKIVEYTGSGASKALSPRQAKAPNKLNPTSPHAQVDPI